MKLVFPNVELRLDMATHRDRAINFHLLFSPDDPNHVEEIERVLAKLEMRGRQGKYGCSRGDLIRLGRSVERSIREEDIAYAKGVEQFKLSHESLLELLAAEKWFRDNCILAVAVGKGDGTSGMRSDGDNSFQELRERIEDSSQVILSGNPADRLYWLGLRGGKPDAEFAARGRQKKPCIHGSDAHKNVDVLAPAEDRRCWIRSELTFEGLRQILHEPADRVVIGEAPPGLSATHERMSALEIGAARCFPNSPYPLNGGLTAIIGAKGSGKTALADLLALGTGAYDGGQVGDASFLKHAGEQLDGAEVTVSWADGAKTSARIGDFPDGDALPQVRYLSQQFVERLCGTQDRSSGAPFTDALRDEIESVVFNATDETDRLAAGSFGELLAARTSAPSRQVGQLRREIAAANRRVAEEDGLKGQQAAKEKALKEASDAVAALEAEFKALVVKGNEEEAKALLALEDELKAATSKLAGLKMQENALGQVRAAVASVRREAAATAAQWRVEFADARLEESEWAAFSTKFAGDVDTIISGKIATVQTAITRASDGPPAEGEPRPLNVIKKDHDATSKALGEGKKKLLQQQVLAAKVRRAGTERDRISKDLDNLKGCDDRKAAAARGRTAAYRGVFEALQEKERILAGLYAPLADRLAAGGQTTAALTFYVRRRVDLARWLQQGEALLDGRRREPLGGRPLEEVVGAHLPRAWREGSPDDVSAALAAVVGIFAKDLAATVGALKQGKTLVDLAEWLFSTEHVSLDYGIRYNGVDIERLSPGTRGIVLLVLYLAIDEWDTRPLVIDQPEENLDPQSIYKDLVGFFRRARGRRQVVLVTHNANLVVNTDVDQVIVASAERTSPTEVPRISYVSGGLENSVIRDRVCEILEGGREAFRQRERRYRLSD